MTFLSICTRNVLLRIEEELSTRAPVGHFRTMLIRQYPEADAVRFKLTIQSLPSIFVSHTHELTLIPKTAILNHARS
jgi:hypothetical protein